MSLTLEQLAETTGLDPGELERLLAEDADRGIVERDGAGWRLTAHAERRYGRALRTLAGEAP